jgi:hypothetical protein
MRHSQQGMSSPGEKGPLPFLFSFFKISPNKQKTNSVASWALRLWKASLCCASLEKKKAETFLPASWLQSWLCETAEQIGKHHTQQVTSLPTPKENNPVQPLGRLNSPPPAKLKTINSEL